MYSRLYKKNIGNEIGSLIIDCIKSVHHHFENYSMSNITSFIEFSFQFFDQLKISGFSDLFIELLTILLLRSKTENLDRIILILDNNSHLLESLLYNSSFSKPKILFISQYYSLKIKLSNFGPSNISWNNSPILFNMINDQLQHYKYFGENYLELVTLLETITQSSRKISNYLVTSALIPTLIYHLSEISSIFITSIAKNGTSYSVITVYIY